MVTISQRISSWTLALRHLQIAENRQRIFAFRRLTEVFKAAKVVPFEDSSRIVFFSDCHRGDNSRADAFARNKELFLRALTHYYHRGFTYVEVGDGDELWKNRQFSVIRRAHRRVFDLLHKFGQQNRLHFILGNHDIPGSRHRRVEKDGIAVDEGLILQHTRTGQQIFAVHGHQADFTSDRLYTLSRFVVRNIWKRLQLLGLGRSPSRMDSTRQRTKIEQRIIEWVQAHRQITICGHTHHPAFTRHGTAPYFNVGSCVYAGYITGLELQNRELALVKWTARPGARQREAPHVERELLAPPRKLCL